MYKTKRRKGFTILEASLAVIIASVMMTTYLVTDMNNQVRLKDKEMASQIKYLGEAAKKYIITNSDSLRTQLTNGGKPIELSIGRTSQYGENSIVSQSPSLQDAGFVNLDYININSFNQNYVLMIGKDTQGNLQGLVFSVGGRSIADYEVGYITSLLGFNGGYIPKNSIGGEMNNMIYGYHGSWIETSANWNNVYTPQSGHLIYKVTPFDGSSSDYFNRYNTGNNDDNKFHTSLYMSNNNVTANSIETTFLHGSNNVMTGIHSYDRQNNVNINGNVHFYNNLGVGVRDNGTYYEAKDNDIPSGWGGGVHTRDLNARDIVATRDMNTNKIKTYMSNWKGNISAASYAEGNVIRSKEGVDFGSPCDNAIKTQSLDSNGMPDIKIQQQHKIGDIGFDKTTGKIATCQKTDDGRMIWSVGMSPFSAPRCYSGGSSYTNNDGVTEIVYYVLDYSASKNTDHFSVSVNEGTAWVGEHSDASIWGFVGSSTKTGHIYSGITMLQPGDTVSPHTGIRILQHCILR